MTDKIMATPEPTMYALMGYFMACTTHVTDEEALKNNDKILETLGRAIPMCPTSYREVHWDEASYRHVCTDCGAYVGYTECDSGEWDRFCRNCGRPQDYRRVWKGDFT
jgi:hypothetical protein